MTKLSMIISTFRSFMSFNSLFVGIMFAFSSAVCRDKVCPLRLDHIIFNSCATSMLEFIMEEEIVGQGNSSILSIRQ